MAGLLFGLLALVSRALEQARRTTSPPNQVNLALYFNAATFVVSALTIYALREIPSARSSAHISAPSVAKTIWEGWRFIGQTRVVRGIVIGMVGAFAAGGVVVGLGPALRQEHPARRQRGLGRRVRRDLRRPGRSACSSACASCAGSAGAGCSA